jgi:hypothetical protein
VSGVAGMHTMAKFPPFTPRGERVFRNMVKASVEVFAPCLGAWRPNGWRGERKVLRWVWPR